MESWSQNPADPAGASSDTEPKAAVPALLLTLRDESEGARRAAVQALGELGAAARAAVPALRQAARDRDEGVRTQAALAIEKIQAEVRAAILRSA